MLNHPKDVQILSSTLIDVARDSHIYYGSKQTVLGILESGVAVGAFHNSSERFDPPKCHPRTRMKVLDMIRDWYLDKEETPTRRVMWLYGPAGAGKSAIAQTMAEECHELHTLAASFFFSRTVPGRNDATRLVATIAYQIAHGIPDTRVYLRQVLDNDPLILSKSLETQFRHLVIGPLLDIIAHGSTSVVTLPKLIIIDGLDECNDNATQQAIVHCLISIVTQYDVPLRILISSRPEQPIREAFSRSERERRGSHVSLVLDNDYQSEKDIQLFLEERFNEIRETHILRSYIPEIWPSHEDICSLVKKSSGQFIFASTVIRYVGSSRHRPMDQLQHILGIGSREDATPFAELDALYVHVLESTDETQRATILRIFGFLLCKVSALGSHLEEPSNMEHYLNLPPGSIFLALAECQSIIHLFPDAHARMSTVYFLHASLSDFLTDSARSGKFFVDQGMVHAELSRACIRGISSLNKHVKAYSMNNLPKHSKKSHMGQTLLEELLHFDLTKLLIWSEDVSFCACDVQPYRACWEQLSYIREQVHTGLHGVSKAFLSSHLATLDNHLRLQLDTFNWPDRVAELFVLDEKLRQIFDSLAGTWIHAGRLLDLVVIHPFEPSKAMRHLFTHGRNSAKMLYLDFLRDEKRAGKMHIGQEIYAPIALQCIKYICGKPHDDKLMKSKHRRDICGHFADHNSASCICGLVVLPSILLSAGPLQELAEDLRSGKSSQWAEITVARAEYLERYDKWAEQQSQSDQEIEELPRAPKRRRIMIEGSEGQRSLQTEP